MQLQPIETTYTQQLALIFIISFTLLGCEFICLLACRYFENRRLDANMQELQKQCKCEKCKQVSLTNKETKNVHN